MLFLLNQHSANENYILFFLVFVCRILENNNIHQISSMTFSGLNSLVLLWVYISILFYSSQTFFFFTLPLCSLKSSKALLLRAFVDLFRLNECSSFEHWRKMHYTLLHCVSLIDRVLLNNSLTKLDDICREMPRLNWL